MKSLFSDEVRPDTPAETARAASALFSKVSHELRTPLSLILGLLSEVLEETGEPLSSWQRNSLETALRNAQLLSATIDALLDLARTQAGHLAARHPPADLAALSRQVAGVFPRAAEPPVPAPIDSPPLRDEQPNANRFHILVADDNADMRLYIERLLSPQYRVTAVDDGLEALEVIRTHAPDLLLTDVMMPKLDGFGLLAAIRQDQELRALPVIMLSARAGDEARSEGIEAGADDYLAKPFNKTTLLAVLKKNLALGQMRQKESEKAG